MRSIAAALLILATASPLAAPPEVTQGGGEMSETADTVAPPHVGRAHFTTGISGREPVDQIRQLTADYQRVYYFTELRGLESRTISHRWEYQGRLMAEVFHQITAPRWRAWSSKLLVPQWTGQWQVSVVDEEGDPLHSDRFQVITPR